LTKPRPELPKSSILTRLERLVPPVEVIAERLAIDIESAKVIHQLYCAIEDATKDLLLAQSEVVQKQAAFLIAQAETTRLANEQAHKAVDARTILKNVSVFISEEVVTAEYILGIMFSDVFATAFGGLSIDRQVDLLAAVEPYLEELLGIELVLPKVLSSRVPDTEAAKAAIEEIDEEE
jgi:hypothetical protein